jgi:charged multivesicular body protein 2B
MFGEKKKLSSKEETRSIKRGISKNQRDLEREIHTLKQREKEIQTDIQKYLKKGDESNAKILAKQLIANRSQQEKMTGMISKMTTLNHKATVNFIIL